MNVTQLFAMQSDAGGWHARYGASIFHPLSRLEHMVWSSQVIAPGSKKHGVFLGVWGHGFWAIDMYKSSYEIPWPSSTPGFSHGQFFKDAQAVKFLWGRDHSNTTLVITPSYDPMEFKKNIG